MLKKIFEKDTWDVKVNSKTKREKLRQAHFETVAQILKNEFYKKKTGTSNIDLQAKRARCVENMQKVNTLNWQYLVVHSDDKQTAINDYESMMVGLNIKQIEKDPMYPKSLHLISLGIHANLYSSVITNPKGALKLLKKAKNNNRD